MRTRLLTLLFLLMGCGLGLDPPSDAPDAGSPDAAVPDHAPAVAEGKTFHFGSAQDGVRYECTPDSAAWMVRTEGGVPRRATWVHYEYRKTGGDTAGLLTLEEYDPRDLRWSGYVYALTFTSPTTGRYGGYRFSPHGRTEVSGDFVMTEGPVLGSVREYKDGSEGHPTPGHELRAALPRWKRPYRGAAA